jgi:hypothetical protein
MCADCGVDLVDRLEDRATTSDTVDIYICYDAQQATRLADLLSNKGMHVLVRDRSSSAFPTNVGRTAQHVVAVPIGDREHAQSVIEAAIHDGIVPADGVMISAKKW